MTDDQARVDASAEQNNSHDKDHNGTNESPGALLREGRERLNLTVAQVAERLRLRQQIINDLEQDQYSKYEANTFTRGYIRAYARLLELDDDRVIAAYEALGYEDKPQAMQSFSRRTKQQSHDNKLMLVTYVVGAVIIGSAVIFWLQNNGYDNGTEQQTRQPSIAERLVDEQDVQVDIAPEPDADSGQTSLREPVFIDTSLVAPERLAQHQAMQNEAMEDDTTVESPEAEAAGSPPQETVQAREVEVETDHTAAVTETGVDEPEQTMSEPLPEAALVLVFSGDAWIRIEDAHGDAIAFGVKPEGHVSALDGDGPFQVTLGAPENVTMYYQGQPIDLSAYRAGRVARFSIPDTE